MIEGYVDPAEEKAVEGPFGDHTGFYSLEDRYPLFHVTALTRRRDAVYPATVVGIPPQEDAWIARATERIFLSPIRMALQPEVRDLTMPEAGTAHNVAVVSIDRRYEGQAVKVAQSLWGAGQMMFNKYLLVVPSGTDVRDSDALARLLRRIDPVRDLVRSEGILDVLDHATATPGFGGKIAIDATTAGAALNPASQSESVPQLSLPEGCRTDLLEKWGAALAFAEPGAGVRTPEGVRYFVLFDPAAAELMPEELLWLAAANTDPRRDVRTEGATLVIDARSKRPGEGGNPARFPNVVTASEATVGLVDRRWTEYGLGAFVESPSRRYRRLLLSGGAQW